VRLTKVFILSVFPPFWFWCSAIFILNQFLEAGGVFIPYVHSYLDDILAIPIVLGFTLAFQQQFTYRNPKYTFSIWHSLIFLLGLSWYFEWYLPSVYNHHYRDPWDIVAYAAGAVFFQRKMNVAARAIVYKTKTFPYLQISRLPVS